ncbi:hypothetical protein Vretimale_12760, partial [Volvox reticuliferus]
PGAGAALPAAAALLQANLSNTSGGAGGGGGGVGGVSSNLHGLSASRKTRSQSQMRTTRSVPLQELLAGVLDQRLVDDVAELTFLEELEIWNVYGTDWNLDHTDFSPFARLSRLRSLKMEALPPYMAFRIHRVMQEGVPYCKLRLVADNEMPPVIPAVAAAGGLALQDVQQQEAAVAAAAAAAGGSPAVAGGEGEGGVDPIGLGGPGLEFDLLGPLEIGFGGYQQQKLELQIRINRHRCHTQQRIRQLYTEPLHGSLLLSPRPRPSLHYDLRPTVLWYTALSCRTLIQPPPRPIKRPVNPEFLTTSGIDQLSVGGSVCAFVCVRVRYKQMANARLGKAPKEAVPIICV